MGEERLDLDDAVETLRARAKMLRVVADVLEDVAGHLERIAKIVNIPSTVAGKIRNTVGKLKFWGG